MCIACQNFWWTPNVPRAQARLDLAYKVTLVSFFALQLTAIACMSLAHCQPPRCHPLLGSSMFIGGNLALIVALNVIGAYDDRPPIDLPTNDD